MANWMDKLSANSIRRVINLWPPFFFSGIKVKYISKDFSQVDVILKFRWYNRNYVGTHFGGNMFAMTDPFFMLILLKKLGPEYTVWDKAAKINFIKPGKGLLRAHFSISPGELELIRDKAKQDKKYLFDKFVNIYNDNDEIVASVEKTLYVRYKHKI